MHERHKYCIFVDHAYQLQPMWFLLMRITVNLTSYVHVGEGCQPAHCPDVGKGLGTRLPVPVQVDALQDADKHAGMCSREL
jgi:hypothetical protein